MCKKEYGTFILKPDIFESGIMNRENIVYLEQLKENYLIKVPQISEREV